MKTRKIKSPVMESKRKATTDLNHDNWDKEVQNEEMGTFQVASLEVLQNRVIKKAKRNFSTTNKETPTNRSVFSGFTGFTNLPTSPSAVISASPFSFLSKIPKRSPPKLQEIPQRTMDPIQEEKIEMNNNEEAKKEENSFGFEKANSFYAKLKGLNEEVSSWIKIHVDKNPLCILTPIFNDYERYLSEIQDNFESSSNTKESTLNELTNGIPKLGSVDKKPADSTHLGSVGFPFKNVSTNIPERKPSQSSILSSSSSSPSMFSLSSRPSDTTSLSTITANKKRSYSGIVSKRETIKVEDSYDIEMARENYPPINEFKAVVEEDSIYSKKCKIFVKNGTNYTDRGVGTLFLKPIKDSTKKQLLVRADTNLGNILLNIILSDAIPTQRLGKNNVMLVCIPTPESDPKPTSVLLRVKTGEEADDLLANIEKYKK